MEHGVRNILTAACPMRIRSMARGIVVWLFGALVVCGCGEPPEPVPGVPEPAKHPDGQSGGGVGQSQPAEVVATVGQGGKTVGEVSRLPEPVSYTHLTLPTILLV